MPGGFLGDRDWSVGDYQQACRVLHCFSIVINSSAVKTASLLHISDTFPYPLIYSEPNPPPPHPAPGPLDPWAWEYLLRTHPDRLYAHTLVNIIRQGVRIGYKGSDQFFISKNLASAEDDPATLTADLLAQKAHNRLKLVQP